MSAPEVDALPPYTASTDEVSAETELIAASTDEIKETYNDNQQSKENEAENEAGANIKQQNEIKQLSNVINEKDTPTNTEEQYVTINDNNNNNDEDDEEDMNSKWIRFGTERSTTADVNKHPEATLEEIWYDFIVHLRHASGYKAEFDIYQILAYRAKVASGAKTYFKPFKTLRGIVNTEWSDMKVRWLTSYQRVLVQAIVCFAIQTIGITAIIITQFSSYFAEEETKNRAQCDYHSQRWKTDYHLKILAFLWTSFISLGVSGWVYKARHSGFYPILLYMKEIPFPNFVSITILQIGLLTNYFVVTCSVFGSYILIYQTEGGTETIGMVLQAVALFFVLELDNKIVHARDFLSIYKYFDLYIKHNKHSKLPMNVEREESDNILQRPCEKCNGESCLQATLSVVSFILLVIMTAGAAVAPFLIMICW